MSKKGWGKFVAFAAVAGAVAAGVSYVLQYKTYHNELEKDFLMKWIDVIDYQQNQIVEIGPERSAQKAEITEITEIR